MDLEFKTFGCVMKTLDLEYKTLNVKYALWIPHKKLLIQSQYFRLQNKDLGSLHPWEMALDLEEV